MYTASAVVRRLDDFTISEIQRSLLKVRFGTQNPTCSADDLVSRDNDQREPTVLRNASELNWQLGARRRPFRSGADLQRAAGTSVGVPHQRPPTQDSDSHAHHNTRLRRFLSDVDEYQDGSIRGHSGRGNRFPAEKTQPGDRNGRINPQLETMRPNLRLLAARRTGQPGSRLGGGLPRRVHEMAARDEGYGVPALGGDHP